MSSPPTTSRTVVIPGAGHWVAEQAPDQLVAALTAFLAHYRSAHAVAGTGKAASA